MSEPNGTPIELRPRKKFASALRGEAEPPVLPVDLTTLAETRESWREKVRVAEVELRHCRAEEEQVQRLRRWRP